MKSNQCDVSASEATIVQWLCVDSYDLWQFSSAGRLSVWLCFKKHLFTGLCGVMGINGVWISWEGRIVSAIHTCFTISGAVLRQRYLQMTRQNWRTTLDQQRPTDRQNPSESCMCVRREISALLPFICICDHHRIPLSRKDSIIDLIMA